MAARLTPLRVRVLEPLSHVQWSAVLSTESMVVKSSGCTGAARAGMGSRATAISSANAAANFLLIVYLLFLLFVQLYSCLPANTSSPMGEPIKIL